ncbi:hypothetical protein EIP91_011949 [Steccherinum ochraceum]|uniref:DUF6533 domain-containing protein n=1 Tax=Steccherinum ochraceum TaxID=92696 RepID=A0A4R0RLC6_9APHY|nr:hypothetical protein EIP91_011949 [Steccherinum ochraceum]
MMSRKAAQAALHYLQFEIQWASIALLWYDYILTFPMEVKYIWDSKFRTSTVLYIFCRYALLANVLYLLALAGKLTHRVRVPCDKWYKFVGALSVLGRAAIVITFTGRVYAVWAANRFILAYLGLLGFACIALDIGYAVSVLSKFRLVSQVLVLPGSELILSSVSGLLSILMVVFEFSVAILTTYRSIQAFRLQKSLKEMKKMGLIYLVFEQGTLYFCAVSIFTVTSLILNLRNPAGFVQRLLNALTLPFSGLLTARFLLHIRRWNAKSMVVTDSRGRSRTNISTLSGFNAVPGGGTSTAVSSIVDEFGTDPVARTLRSAVSDEAGISDRHTTSSGSIELSRLDADGAERAGL